MPLPGSTADRIVLAITALAALALAGLSVGLVDAGFVDALGTLARTVAGLFGVEGKDTLRAIELGAEAVGRIGRLLFS